MTAATIERSKRLVEAIARRRARLTPPRLTVEGKLTRIVGLTLEAVGCEAAIGERCTVVAPDGREVQAEVVGFANGKTYLMPVGELQGLIPNARVIPSEARHMVGVGEGLLGRVLDGTGSPLDGKGDINAEQFQSMTGAPINPLGRMPIREPLDVGVRAINALLSVGRGQRMGLFAGSGVGKSSLLGMMTRFTDADVTVVGLIGERGREVNEFVQEILGEDGLSRAVVVAVPADNSPLLRVHGAMLATSIAEYFRDLGKDVLLLMDSLTRFAQAQREIALAIGEPPATKGYPPSVFAKLPQLVERTGMGDGGRGSITALYTVLAEGDDHNDPIADAARAILDGHIVLSRSLAEAGHYPAIDLEASVSRVMNAIATPEQLALTRRFRQLYSKYEHNRDLIGLGVYQRGSDPQTDEAIEYHPHLVEFLKQEIDESVSIDESLEQLDALFNSVSSGQPALTA